jgi:protein O-GlcNAc transferase
LQCTLQAFACFSNALALDPAHADTLMAAGALYKSCGLLPEALNSLEAALAARPKDLSFRLALAVVLTDLGELWYPFVQLKWHWCTRKL